MERIGSTHDERHLDRHTLDRYILGFINDKADLARIQEHLDQCCSCKHAMQANNGFVEAVRAAERLTGSAGSDA
jgi:hypothetical protein